MAVATITTKWLGVEVLVSGDYYAGTRGDNEDPSEFEIESVQIGGVQVDQMLACMKVVGATGKASAWALGDLRDLCLEKFEEQL